MQGVYLKLFVSQTAKQHGMLLYEWILEEAQRLGVGGGTAYRAIAGFGHHGRLHEEHFFELPDDLPIGIEFVTGEAQKQKLLERLEEERVSMFYLCHPVEFSTIP